MLALLSALKEETADVRRHMLCEEISGQEGCRIFRGSYRNKAILLIQSGMGKERTERATNFILEHYPVTALVSLGFAGALTEEAKVGDIFLCSTLYSDNGETPGKNEEDNPYHSDPGLVSLACQAPDTTAKLRQGSSVTTTQLVSQFESRQALGKIFQADIVDMESYWTARIASAKGVPFLAIRAISDSMRDNLPPFDRMLDSNGSWQRKEAGLYFLTHPQQMIKLFTLFRNARQAGRNLSTLVDCLLAKLENETELLR